MKRFIAFYFIISLFYSCAIRVDPTGGPKDVTPPKVVKTVPENFSVNVKPIDIVLTFDEIVQLKDVSTQLVVSPLLKYTPETKVRKHSVYIHFLDTLEENTTYTMNFGKSIADNNEGNLLEDYQFVFSTSGILDSLKIRGKIENAFDRKTTKGMIAMLYRGSDDSLPYKQRPLYFAKTNDNGEFTINNIAPGDYKFIAMEDKDGNFLYSNGEEKIGYSESRVSAGDTSVMVSLFKEPPPLHLTKSLSIAPGKAILIFSAPADTVKLNWISDINKLDVFAQEFSKEKDSLTILYKNVTMDSLSFYYFNGKKQDTIDVRLFKKDKQSPTRGKFELSLTAADQNIIHHFNLPFKINANHPISSFSSEKFVLKKDSVVQPNINITFVDSQKTSMQINSIWSEKSSYELFIPPGSVEDVYELKNDSVNIEWTIRPETSYGTLFFKMISVKESLIVQLLDTKENLIRESYVEGDTAIQYSYLEPSVYQVKLIHDVNKNKVWDTGNLLRKIQPEITEYYPEKITVRANWDVDLKWDLNAEP